MNKVHCYSSAERVHSFFKNCSLTKVHKPKVIPKKNKKNLKGKERLFGSTEACGTDVTKALACHDAAVDYFKLLKGKVGQTRAQNPDFFLFPKR